MFEIASNPSIPLSQIRERRFDLIERAQEVDVDVVAEYTQRVAAQLRESIDNHILGQPSAPVQDPMMRAVMDLHASIPFTATDEDPNS